MSRYDCEFATGFRVSYERFPHIPALLDALHRQEFPQTRIRDSRDNSYKRLQYLPDQDIYDLYHLTYGKAQPETAHALLIASTAVRQMEGHARKLLGQWRGETWVPHESTRIQDRRRAILWEFYEREARECAIAASAELEVRDARAIRVLRNMARAIRRATGRATVITGPRDDQTPTDLVVHRIAAATGPDELAMAVLYGRLAA